MQDYQDILFEINDRVAIITLNRPKRFNAWTLAMEASVKQAVQTVTDDEKVRVIVITGAGESFCAGMDVNNVSETAGIWDEAVLNDSTADLSSDDSELNLKNYYTGPFAYLVHSPKPIVAALNGVTAGLGMVIALYADLRFASSNASFTSVFARRGLVAEHGISWLLPRLVGLGNTMDILLSSRKISAYEAKQMGLVNDVFKQTLFMDEVMAYAETLVKTVSPRSMAIIKAQVWQSLHQDFNGSLATTGKEISRSIESEDFKEGFAHFIEKRQPSFTGR